MVSRPHDSLCGFEYIITWRPSMSNAYSAEYPYMYALCTHSIARFGQLTSPRTFHRPITGGGRAPPPVEGIFLPCMTPSLQITGAQASRAFHPNDQPNLTTGTHTRTHTRTCTGQTAACPLRHVLCPHQVLHLWAQVRGALLRTAHRCGCHSHAHARAHHHRPHLCLAAAGEMPLCVWIPRSVAAAGHDGTYMRSLQVRCGQ